MSAVNLQHLLQFPHLRLENNRETADCSVRALAVACNTTYSTAYCAMQEEGRQPGGSGSAAMMFAAARLMGYRMIRVKPEGKTILTSERALVGTLGGYVLVTCDHAAGVWDGVVIDFERGSLARVCQTFRMEKRL